MSRDTESCLGCLSAILVLCVVAMAMLLLIAIWR